MCVKIFDEKICTNCVHFIKIKPTPFSEKAFHICADKGKVLLHPDMFPQDCEKFIKAVYGGMHNGYTLKG